MPEPISLDALEQFMARQRANREFTSEPVDDALVERILAMATRAPSARNAQTWRFVVVRDRETKSKLGAIFDELGGQMYGANAPQRTPWGDVPVLVAVCSEAAFGTDEAGMTALGASIYPAVQNLLLAAQAAGLGTVLTTRAKRREADLRPLLGLPGAVGVYAIIPMGWPAQKLGRNRRKPVADVTFSEQYGQPWQATAGGH
jgi:nitroreductase